MRLGRPISTPWSMTNGVFAVAGRGEAHDDAGEGGGRRAGRRVLADAPAGGEHAGAIVDAGASPGV